MVNEVKDGDLVLPGDKLGVIEEFMPGEGTYQENGVIYASKIGTVRIDVKNKKVTVGLKVERPLLPKKGDMVIGQVSQVSARRALVSIGMIRDTPLPSIFSGILLVKDVKKTYLTSVSDAFKPGDIIKASILDNRNNIFQLSTEAPNLGVIKAYCSKCGMPLIRIGRSLKCPQCGNIERRKTASDYLENKVRT
ncbi:MAG: exosome complex RNA-binding protein Csl4 [Candidatus Odinarchaeia archaeon]